MPRICPALARTAITLLETLSSPRVVLATLSTIVESNNDATMMTTSKVAAATPKRRMSLGARVRRSIAEVIAPLRSDDGRGGRDARGARRRRAHGLGRRRASRRDSRARAARVPRRQRACGLALCAAVAADATRQPRRRHRGRLGGG